MANKTTNFNLDLPTGDELFNPLWPNSNTAKIDTQMKTNQDNSITNADCVFNTNKFIITRNASGGKYFKFIAPADYVAGYTFQVDGTAYDGIVAGTGDSLADGCFMLNHEVIAYIDETSASLAFLVGSSLPEEIDATTLGGHDVDYFGTAAGVTDAKETATAAGTVANQALEAAQKAGMKMTVLWENSSPSGEFTDGTEVTFSTKMPTDTKILGIEFGGSASFGAYRNTGLCLIIPGTNSILWQSPIIEHTYPISAGNTSSLAYITAVMNNLNTTGTASFNLWESDNTIKKRSGIAVYRIFALS